MRFKDMSGMFTSHAPQYVNSQISLLQRKAAQGQISREEVLSKDGQMKEVFEQELKIDQNNLSKQSASQGAQSPVTSNHETLISAAAEFPSVIDNRFERLEDEVFEDGVVLTALNKLEQDIADDKGFCSWCQKAAKEMENAAEVTDALAKVMGMVVSKPGQPFTAKLNSEVENPLDEKLMQSILEERVIKVSSEDFSRTRSRNMTISSHIPRAVIPGVFTQSGLVSYLKQEMSELQTKAKAGALTPDQVSFEVIKLKNAVTQEIDASERALFFLDSEETHTLDQEQFIAETKDKEKNSRSLLETLQSIQQSMHQTDGYEKWKNESVEEMFNIG